jgi:betaine-aldehyde dehydrogenase
MLARPLLIDGNEVDGSAQALESINPATGAVNHRVSAAGPAEVERAVESAQRAASAKAWRNLNPHERAGFLHRMAALVERDAERLATLQRLENGKVHAECVAQASHAAATFRYFAAVCETAASELTPPRGEYLSMTVHEPYGVVAAITPWNSPLSMDAQKVAPALAAGNAVILKPSEVTPSTALEIGRIALEAGLPPGLLNVLPGRGAETGLALVEHPGVKMLSFTGGTSTGRHLATLAAKKLMPVALELGGKSPHIVFEDAKLGPMLNAITSGIFEGSGQSCVAGSRVFVHQSLYARVVDALVSRAEAIRVGQPDVAGAQMGPLASFAHRDRVSEMVEAARASGAQVVAGGSAPQGGQFDKGAFYKPTVVVGIDNDAAIAQQEIFGPVLCVMPFESEDEVVSLANSSDYGLAAGIWTEDFSRAWRVARAIDAGTVWINTYKRLSISAPFGGFKDSGLGREKGVCGMRLYQQVKSVYFGL